jgi:hypothetical protein
MNLWKFHPQKTWVLKKSLIVIRSKRTQAFLNKKELIKLIFSRKHRITIYQLSHYATDCPEINLARVARPNKQLRWTIPPCCYIISKLFFALRTLYLPSESEITNLELPSITDKQILRFYVPMHQLKRMHICQTLEQLIHKTPNKLRLKPIG